MKTTITRLGGAFCAALLLHWGVTADPITISYTYDPAGRLVAADYGGGLSESYVYDHAGNLLQSSAPSPGLILGPVVNGQFSVAWPSAPAGFVLESTIALGPNAVWSPVAAQTTQMSGRIVVTLSVGPTATFYRLRR